MFSFHYCLLAQYCEKKYWWLFAAYKDRKMWFIANYFDSSDFFFLQTVVAKKKNPKSAASWY